MQGQLILKFLWLIDAGVRVLPLVGGQSEIYKCTADTLIDNHQNIMASDFNNAPENSCWVPWSSTE